MNDLFTLRAGGTFTILWSGEMRMVICDRVEGDVAVMRDLTSAEKDSLDQQEYDEYIQRRAEAP
jgi:hypothetical protein